MQTRNRIMPGEYSEHGMLLLVHFVRNQLAIYNLHCNTFQNFQTWSSENCQTSFRKSVELVLFLTSWPPGTGPPHTVLLLFRKRVKKCFNKKIKTLISNFQFAERESGEGKPVRAGGSFQTDFPKLQTCKQLYLVSLFCGKCNPETKVLFVPVLVDVAVCHSFISSQFGEKMLSKYETSIF